ncbi:MAG: radical SAM protein [Nitrospirae bacterium]|nr:radical SAM protein [Nitrospirota bacterium]
MRVIGKYLLHLQSKGIYLNKYDALVYLLERHTAPALVNELLCIEEAEMSIEEVKSYPLEVHMDMSTICNIRCRFCKYTPGMYPVEMITLDYIKSIEWFKYIRRFYMAGLTGETLTNPEFIEIFNFIRDTYPHLILTLYTNGAALSEKVINTIAGRLDCLHVSINAATKEDYNNIIKNGNWDVFSANMKHMANMRKNFDKPVISASFIMVRSNIDNAVRHVEFARDHGISTVQLPHYIHGLNAAYCNSDLSGQYEKFTREDSLYFERQKSDDMFEQAAQCARESGINLMYPVPFQCNDYVVRYGRKTLDRSWKCFFPWTNIHLHWGAKSKRREVIFCCGTATDNGIFYNKEDVVTKEGLLRIRNDKILCLYRRTVNGPKVNNVCNFCRSYDVSDPDSGFPLSGGLGEVS